MQLRSEKPSALRERWLFYSEVWRATGQVGAFSRSSRALASRMASAIPLDRQPVRVLEVGSGTGALTRALVERLRPGDALDLCELNPSFASFLRAAFAGRAVPHVRILECDVTLLRGAPPYDAIVSSLPLLNLSPAAVEQIFEVCLALLKPWGQLSYYDYWGKELRRFATPSRVERTRLRAVLDVTQRFLDRHQLREEVLPWNVPPASIHHLRASAAPEPRAECG
jgi:phospholipid N-methyltransferase